MSIFDQVIGRVARSAAQAVTPDERPPLSGVFSIPHALGLPANPGQVTLPSGQIDAGYFADSSFHNQPLLRIPPVNLIPRHRIQILRMYLPFRVVAFPADYSAPTPTYPTVCDFSLGIALRGAPSWVWEGQVATVPDTSNTQTAVGNGVATVDFVNPLILDPIDQASIAYQLWFDQPCGTAGATPPPPFPVQPYNLVLAPTVTGVPEFGGAAIHWEAV